MNILVLRHPGLTWLLRQTTPPGQTRKVDLISLMGIIPGGNWFIRVKTEEISQYICFPRLMVSDF